MDDFDPHADPVPAPDALHGLLRQAVEHICAQPVPLDSQRRVLERIQHKSRPMPVFQNTWRLAAVAACIVAPILLTLFMRASDQPARHPKPGTPLAVVPRGLGEMPSGGAKAGEAQAQRAKKFLPDSASGFGIRAGQGQSAQANNKRPAPVPGAAPAPLKDRMATPRPMPQKGQAQLYHEQVRSLRGQSNSGGQAMDPNLAGAPVRDSDVTSRPGGFGGRADTNRSRGSFGRGLGGGGAGFGGGLGGRGAGFGGGVGGMGGPIAGKPLETPRDGDAKLASNGAAAESREVQDRMIQSSPRGPLLRNSAWLPGREPANLATPASGRLTGGLALPAQRLRKDKRLPGLDEAGRNGSKLGRRGRNATTPAPFGGFANSPPEGTEFKAAKKAADKKPAKYWRRQASHPTFAHVYVGDGNALELVSLQVTTTIEGPRARTVVDHIFYNPHNQQLEGTFEYPLPAGASPSYFAMFLGSSRAAVPPRFGFASAALALPTRALAGLTPAELVKHVNTADWGRLQEAHVVARAKALDIYEQVIRQRIDPALLEYQGGNTFSGRVFPIPAKGYNRVILAYEELLPCTGGTVQYHFPLPDGKLQELQYSLSIDTANCQQAHLNLKNAHREEGGGRVRYSQTWTKQGPGGSVQFTFVPPDPQVQAISGRQNESGPLYFYARIRPNLKVQDAKPYADHAVFLLDTSYSEERDGFARNMKLLQAILEADSGIKQFNVLAFNIGASWLQPGGWFDNTPAGREAAFARLDGIVLEGATDLSAALDKLAHPGFKLPPGTPLDAFLLSDADITWGETDVNTLVARFDGQCPYRVRFNCYRTGLGADNLTLFEALTRKGGGVFNCLTDDVKPVALAHRRQCLQLERVSVVGLPGASDVLVAGRKAAIFPDGELLVTGRVGAPGHGTLLLEGTFLGKKFAEEYPLEVKASDELAPRGWGEVAVASLLALNDPTYDDLVTAYCQQFSIGSRVASFLVLENENDYKRLNLEAERGKLVKDGDLGHFLETSWQTLGSIVSPREAFERFLAQIGPRVHLFDGPNGSHVKSLLATLTDKDYELPTAMAIEALLQRRDVSPDYLKARAVPGDNSNAFIAEAKRRVSHHDKGGAVRCLSSIIEEFPGRSDALRLVGYRLLDLDQPAQAARLFRQVQRQRPFEPHSYLDLARSLEASGRYGLAAVQYEMVLAGNWDARFHASLKTIALEDYLLMMRQAIRKKRVAGKLADAFGERLEHMAAVKTASDLRVTISWNTDNTDVDLWVIEPDGTKCFYQHRQTTLGGVLSQDQTQGFGPERYQMVKAAPGVYTIYVHYFRPNPNLLAGETHVNVVITRHADTPKETVQRHTIILKKGNEAVEVAKVKF